MYTITEKPVYRFYKRFAILKNWKKNSYNLIFVIVNNLTKLIYYKLV